MGVQESVTTPLPPFLKWAGGKRWLVENHLELLNIHFERYIEPFLGSGAVFFRLAPKSAILSDSNAQLIDTYRAIGDDWKKVLRLLRNHHRSHTKEYYYKIRAQKPRSSAGGAARFIYLNRTCWNGLYRVNLRGQFNVPIGTKTNVILSTDDFEKCASLLANAKLYSQDFETILGKAKTGDFVFVDPPYTVRHNDNAFIKYNESLFSWEDQIRLRNCVRSALDRGAKLIITNACNKCIQELYYGIGEHITLSRASVISGKSSARGKYDEMVIKCLG
ncbi:MAG: Dam family site-specific DNA-(adenine-N6)-methyltransferase [bacterium]